MRWKPRPNTRCADSTMSSSVTFLVITSRMRCVPASGANVSPPARMVAISPSRSSFSPYARSDETDSDTFSSRSFAIAAFTSGVTHE